MEQKQFGDQGKTDYFTSGKNSGTVGGAIHTHKLTHTPILLRSLDLIHLVKLE